VGPSRAPAGPSGVHALLRKLVHKAMQLGSCHGLNVVSKPTPRRPISAHHTRRSYRAKSSTVLAYTTGRVGPPSLGRSTRSRSTPSPPAGALPSLRAACTDAALRRNARSKYSSAVARAMNASANAWSATPRMLMGQPWMAQDGWCTTSTGPAECASTAAVTLPSRCPASPLRRWAPSTMRLAPRFSATSTIPFHVGAAWTATLWD
jgi:hypothetical protein